MTLTVEDIIRILDLKPLPKEGGYYRETYRSDETFPAASLPKRYASPRAVSTDIYYLITPHECSRLHRVASDEIFHYHLGDPAEMLLLHPDGRSQLLIIGPDIAAGQRLQVVVPRDTWQATRVCPGGAFCLMGTTVAPGFDFADFTPAAGHVDELVRRFPDRAELIRQLE